MDVVELKNKYPLFCKKMDILCHGINIDNEGLLYYYYNCQNPLDTHRTGNAGLQVKLGEDRLPLNVAVYKKFCKSSPFFLTNVNNNELGLLDIRDNSIIDVFCPNKAPAWYEKDVQYGEQKAKIGNFVLLEGDFTAITSITSGCLYFNKGQPCAFCAIGADATLDYDIDKRRNMILSALLEVVEDPIVTNFHLTGGNTFDTDRGALAYVGYVETLRAKREDAAIAVEIPPPEKSVQREIFLKLKKIGVDSITINIEFWDDEIRRKIMPIKGSIAKTDYISAYYTALDIFGPNKVTCGFIVGVEDIENTYRGIEYLTDLGVVTEVYPFKPNSGSLMEKHPLTNLEDILKVSLFADVAMKKNRIAPNLCSGCVKCGACGLTQELAKINSN